MSFNERIPAKRLEIRTRCLVCSEWQGSWNRTPNEGLQEFATHLVENHPEVLADPEKLHVSRKDEFRYGPETEEG